MLLNVTRNDLFNEEEDLLTYWQSICEAWRKNSVEYDKFIQYLGTIYSGSFENYAPLQLIGDFWGQSDKVLVVSTLPEIPLTKAYKKFENSERGFAKQPDQREQYTWVNQLLLAINYFNLLWKYDLKIVYFEKLDLLLQYYQQISSKNTPLYETLQKKVIQTYLIPFYSKNVTLQENNAVIEGSFNRIKRFYFSNDFHTILIQGKDLYEKLVEWGYLKRSEENIDKIKESRGADGVDEFLIEAHGLKQKGLAIPIVAELDNETMKEITRRMRNIASWNSENYWKNDF